MFDFLGPQWVPVPLPQGDKRTLLRAGYVDALFEHHEATGRWECSLSVACENVTRWGATPQEAFEDASEDLTQTLQAQRSKIHFYISCLEEACTISNS